jgi:hypothetical protein
MTRSLRCMVAWHRWVPRRNDEGIGYLVCARCGKEDFSVSVPPGVHL